MDPVILLFTRAFTRGSLAGLTHNSRLPFISEGAALAWLIAVRRNHARGALDYLIGGARVLPHVPPPMTAFLAGTKKRRARDGRIVQQWVDRKR